MANNNNQRKMPKFNIFWMYGLIIIFLLSVYWLNMDGGVTREVSWTQFEKIIKDGGVQSITVYSNKNLAEAVLSDSAAQKVAKELPAAPSTTFGSQQQLSNKISAHIPSSDKFDDRVDAWKEQGVFNGEIKYDQVSDYSSLVWNLGFLVLLVLFWVFMLRRMGGGSGGGSGIFSVGKSKARLFDVLLHVGFRLCRDVCRCGCIACA